MRYGLVREKVEADHYVLGGLTKIPKTVLQPDGNWSKHVPKYEPQAESYETWGCTCWGTQNAIEMLFKRLYGYEPNFSERFNYILTHIREPGASPHDLAECVRKQGLIDAESLPVPPTYEEFIQPDPMETKYIVKGQSFLNTYEFGHDWVFNSDFLSPEEKTALLKEALTFSPVGVSVTAWYEKDGLYYDHGLPNTHWCVLIAFEPRQDGDYPVIFDSYDHSIKVLDKDHNIMMAKRYYIGRRVRKDNWLMLLIKRLFNLK